MSEVAGAVREDWERRIDQASLKLAPDLTSRTLAEEFGDLEADVADELCNEAARVAIKTGATEVAMAHFLDAADEVDGLAEDDEEGTDSTPERDDPDADPGADDDSGGRDDADDEIPPDEIVTAASDDVADEDSRDADHGTDSGDDDVDQDADDEPTPAEMDRDALEAEVQDLRGRVESLEGQVDKLQDVANRDLALMRGAMNRLLGKPGDLETFPEAAADFHDRVDTAATATERLEAQFETDGGKDQKVAAIVETARNLRDGQAVVQLTAHDVKSATGCSRRYAYDLMDDLPEEYDWILAKQDIRQYGDLEIKKSDGSRRIGIDFEGVHSTGVPVNKFTTRPQGTGGS